MNRTVIRERDRIRANLLLPITQDIHMSMPGELERLGHEGRVGADVNLHMAPLEEGSTFLTEHRCKRWTD